MHRLLVIAFVALLPNIGWAGAWSKGCGFTGGDLTGTVGTPDRAVVSSVDSVGPNALFCYRFNNADSTHFSPAILVTAPTALIIVDTQLDADITVATTTLVVPRLCSAGAILTAANPERSCMSLGGVGTNTSLDGVGGPVATQNSRLLVGPGLYTFQVTGACLASDTCQIAVRGEP
jgi:hypothetical protein